MTMPFDSRRTSQCSPWSDLASKQSYRVAAIRAAAISLVLLAVLAALVIF
jgi:hypothetical protein